MSEQNKTSAHIARTDRSNLGPVIMSGIGGGLLGGIIGFLLRPANSLIGQLPFETVISRGANLEGVDQLLVPLAQKSFNTLIIGVFIGIIVGALIGYFISNKR